MKQELTASDLDTSKFGTVNADFNSLLADLENQIEDLFELSSFGAYTITEDGTCTRINSQALKWLGCPREAILGKKKPSEPVAAANWEKLQECNRQRSINLLDNFEFDLTDSRGHPQFFQFLPSTSAPDNRLSYYRSVFFDVTEHKRHAERQRIAAIAFESQMGICIADAFGLILEANSAFSKVTGHSLNNLRKKPFDFLFSLPDNAILKATIHEALSAKGEWEGEIRDLRKDGSIFTGWMNISKVPTEGNLDSYYVCCLYDITASKVSQEEIHNLAYFDSLTQLPNRRKLNDRLARILSTIPRSHFHGAVLFIDLDNFKSLNDTKGHAAGDLLLIEVGNRLQRTVREGDTVARVGGDEFVVLLGELSADLAEASHQANTIGTKILNVLAQPYKLDDFEFNCSASVGINIFGHGDLAEDVFQHADMAMYQAKKNGRNSLCFYDPSMKASATAYANLEQELGRAMEFEQLALFFQPQFDYQGDILSVEALLRWLHPDRGLLEPAEFISIAEESGLIVPIGFWVIECACEQIRRWASDPALCKLQIAINVSARQFQDPNFVRKTFQLVQSSGIDGSMLKLELTESMMHDIDQVREKMEKIRELGIRFSLDDFGTGYSSLASIIKLPLEQLKIDQIFIRNMLSNSGDTIVVKTIIAMAHSLGMNVIAEGLETEEEKHFLKELGCSSYQGYLLSPPLPLPGFEHLFRQQHRFTESAATPP